jgi:hypothetical protein
MPDHSGSRFTSRDDDDWSCAFGVTQDSLTYYSLLDTAKNTLSLE